MNYDDRPHVTFTARCPAGDHDADWASVLVVVRESAYGGVTTAVSSLVDCPACDLTLEQAA